MCRAVSGDSIPFIVYILQIADEDLSGEIFGFILSHWSRCGAGNLLCRRPIHGCGLQNNHSSCRRTPGQPTTIFATRRTHLDSEERIDDSTCVYYLLNVDSLDSVGHRSSTIALSNFCVLCVVYAGEAKTISLRGRSVYVVPLACGQDTSR